MNHSGGLVQLSKASIQAFQLLLESSSAPNIISDLTRPGIAIYGGEAVNGVANPMRPTIKAEARILQIREAKAGESVSYGASLKLARDSRLAIASAGYADGYQRSASGSGVRPAPDRSCRRLRLYRRPQGAGRGTA